MNEEEVRINNEIKKRWANTVKTEIYGNSFFHRCCGSKMYKARVYFSTKGLCKHFKPHTDKIVACKCADCGSWYAPNSGCGLIR
jgi:hypothetical protein